MLKSSSKIFNCIKSKTVVKAEHTLEKTRKISTYMYSRFWNNSSYNTMFTCSYSPQQFGDVNWTRRITATYHWHIINILRHLFTKWNANSGKFYDYMQFHAMFHFQINFWKIRYHNNAYIIMSKIFISR